MKWWLRKWKSLESNENSRANLSSRVEIAENY